MLSILEAIIISQKTDKLGLVEVHGDFSMAPADPGKRGKIIGLKLVSVFACTHRDYGNGFEFLQFPDAVFEEMAPFIKSLVNLLSISLALWALWLSGLSGSLGSLGLGSLGLGSLGLGSLGLGCCAITISDPRLPICVMACLAMKPAKSHPGISSARPMLSCCCRGKRSNGPWCPEHRTSAGF